MTHTFCFLGLFSAKSCPEFGAPSRFAQHHFPVATTWRKDWLLHGHLVEWQHARKTGEEELLVGRETCELIYVYMKQFWNWLIAFGCFRPPKKCQATKQLKELIAKSLSWSVNWCRGNFTIFRSLQLPTTFAVNPWPHLNALVSYTTTKQQQQLLLIIINYLYCTFQDL